MTDDNTIVKDLLGEEFGKSLIAELGIENDPPEAQAALIDNIGLAVMERITLEILKILPESEHQKYNAFAQTGDIVGLRTFVGAYIPDLDTFIFEAAQREYEGIKTEMRKIEQGADV